MTRSESYPNPVVLDYWTTGERSELKYCRPQNSWRRPKKISLL